MQPPLRGKLERKGARHKGMYNLSIGPSEAEDASLNEMLSQLVHSYFTNGLFRIHLSEL